MRVAAEERAVIAAREHTATISALNESHQAQITALVGTHQATVAHLTEKWNTPHKQRSA